MMTTTRKYAVIPLLLFAFLILAFPRAGRADSLFRFYPEFMGAGLYSDNVPLRITNETGDFAGTMAAGFYLDYTSAARYASLHYDTFAQLFAHQTRFDRAGEGQFVHADDYENLSPTTHLRLNEFFYRDAPTVATIVTSGEAPQFNTVAAQLLLANDQASVNQFNAELSHYWQRNWSTILSVHQTTFWNNGGTNGGNNNSSYNQNVTALAEYHFSDRLSIGPGYRFYDFRFTAPGVPGEYAQWPFVRITLLPIRNLYLSGMAGIVISHTQGTNEQAVNPGGIGSLQYDLHHAHLKIYGGQEPELTSGLSGAAEIRGVRGVLLYDFTPRLTGSAGGGFFQVLGSGFDGQLISWGFGLSDRVNKWMSVYARFVQLRRTETTTTASLLPSGSVNGQEAVGDYFVVGLSASIEAFRWSWQ
ncbi:MAG TPA: hypothetical protein VK686_03770 [Bryobacteraceae bacterium]|jgi:hypothetical protein|nr:hypothetical protein [Bryobacteraceae bacterium]